MVDVSRADHEDVGHSPWPASPTGAAVSDAGPRPALWRTIFASGDDVDIRGAVIAPRSPWHNAYAERVIGSIRRECLDHVVGASVASSRIFEAGAASRSDE